MSLLFGQGDFGLNQLLQAALEALSQTEEYRNQAEIFASLAQNQFDEKGNWNAATNTPTLTADPAAYRTGEKLPAFTINVPGNLPFDIIDKNAGEPISTGRLIAHPVLPKWYYDPGNSDLLTRLLPFELAIKFREQDLRVVDGKGYITFQVTSDGVTKAATIDTKSITIDGKVFNPNDFANRVSFENLSKLFVLRPDGTAEFNDSNGFSAAKLTSSGIFMFANLLAAKLQATALNASDISSGTLKVGDMSVKTNAEGHLEIKDNNGFILYSSKPKPSPRKYGYLADVLHFSTYGQSNSVGQGGNPAVTTASIFSNVITFFKGPYMYLYDNDATKYNDFKPAVEESYETGAVAIGNEVTRQVNAKGITIDSSANFTLDILVSAAGQGGLNITQLSKGQTSYTRWLNTIANGKVIANSKNKTYSAIGELWTQGEADIGAKMYAPTYRDLLRKLRQDKVADVKTLNPSQANEYFMIITQISSFNKTSDNVPYPDISLMQYIMGLTEPGFYPGPVMYPFTYLDDTHLANADEYAKMHKLAGYIFNKIAIEGVEWKGIYVKSTKCEGKFLDIEFGVPVEPLVLDTSIVSNPGNFGFRLFNAAGVEQTIVTNSVKVVRPNTVRIVGSSNITPGMVVTYAVNGTPGKSGPTQGARGCLRDSLGNSLKYKPESSNIRVDNYCPHFSHTIKS